MSDSSQLPESYIEAAQMIPTNRIGISVIILTAIAVAAGALIITHVLSSPVDPGASQEPTSKDSGTESAASPQPTSEDSGTEAAASAKPTSEDSGTESAESPKEVPVELVWEPPLFDATGAAARELTMTVKLQVCENVGKCRRLESFVEGTQIYRAELSQRREIAYVWFESPQGEELVQAFALDTGEMTGQCELDDGVVRQPLSTRSIAVGGENVMLRWGAGSNVVESLVCNSQGEIVVRPGGSALELSPDGNYAATFPGYGTPLAAGRSVVVYGLVDGDYSIVEHPSLSFGYVESFRWEDDVVGITVMGRESPDDEDFEKVEFEADLPSVQ